MNGFEEKTLKELLDDYFLVIPDYQREYAQGRDNDRDRNVLDMFIDTIASSLQEGKELHFDFIYGNIRKENGIDVFFPVDGQQRLTTLFLFYVYCYQGREDNSFLNKFRYEVQPETTRFVQLLIKNGVHEPDNHKDWEEWFRIMSSIYSDPCSVSLLRAYRAIEKKVGKINKEEYIKRLEEITFRFLSTEGENQRYSLPDSIFWKMNARGRQLTAAEIFKAVYYRDDRDAKDFDDFAVMLFKQLKAENNINVFDNTLIYIVNIIFEGFAIISDKDSDVAFINTSYVPKEEYTNLKGKYDTEIKGIFKYLGNDLSFGDFTENLPKYRKKYDIYAGLTNQNLSKDMRILFFCYLLAGSYCKNAIEIRREVRVCSNLIRNMDSEAALRTIYAKGICKTSDVLSSLSKERKDKIPNPQYQEECNKARAIENKFVTEPAVEEAESLGFADGAIRYLFTDGTGEVSEDSWEDFNKKCGNFKRIFASSEQCLAEAILKYVEYSDIEKLYNKKIFASDTWRSILLNDKELGFSHYLLTGADMEKRLDYYPIRHFLAVSSDVFLSYSDKGFRIKDLRLRWHNYYPYLYPEHQSGREWYHLDGASPDGVNFVLNNELYCAIISKGARPCDYEWKPELNGYVLRINDLENIKIRDGFVVGIGSKPGYRRDFYFEYKNHYFVLGNKHNEVKSYISEIKPDAKGSVGWLDYDKDLLPGIINNLNMLVKVESEGLMDADKIREAVEKKAEDIITTLDEIVKNLEV